MAAKTATPVGVVDGSVRGGWERWKASQMKLDAERLWPGVPSTMSLLGLVRHLAEVERATFRVMMSGQDVSRLLGHVDLLRERIDGRIGQ